MKAPKKSGFVPREQIIAIGNGIENDRPLANEAETDMGGKMISHNRA